MTGLQASLFKAIRDQELETVKNLVIPFFYVSISFCQSTFCVSFAFSFGELPEKISKTPTCGFAFPIKGWILTNMHSILGDIPWYRFILPFVIKFWWSEKHSTARGQQMQLLRNRSSFVGTKCARRCPKWCRVYASVIGCWEWAERNMSGWKQQIHNF